MSDIEMNFVDEAIRQIKRNDEVIGHPIAETTLLIGLVNKISKLEKALKDIARLKVDTRYNITCHPAIKVADEALAEHRIRMVSDYCPL